MNRKILEQLDLFLNEIWYDEGWYIRYYHHESKMRLRILLQHPPCSGKKAGPEDIYTKKIDIGHRRAPDYPTWYHALGNGNPGAMEVAKEMEQLLQWHDFPAGIDIDRIDPVEIFVFLYANEIIGPKLWKLYKDHLDEDAEKLVMHVYEALTSSYIHCSPDNYLIDPNMMRREVRRDPLNRSPGPPGQG